jgi:hypothetical protein
MSRGARREDIFHDDVDRQDVHLNPVRARLLVAEERLLRYP